MQSFQYKVVVKRQGRAIEVHVGSKADSDKTFETWSKDAWDGWTIEQYTPKDRLIRSAKGGDFTND